MSQSAVLATDSRKDISLESDNERGRGRVEREE